MRADDTMAVIRALYVLAFAFIVVLLATASHADWVGATTPEMEEWFRAQRNRLGEVCCDRAESQYVDDYQWRGDHCDVTVEGQTFSIPPDKEAANPNKFGAAIIWHYPKDEPLSVATLRCFMRSAEG